MDRNELAARLYVEAADRLVNGAADEGELMQEGLFDGIKNVFKKNAQTTAGKARQELMNALVAGRRAVAKNDMAGWKAAYATISKYGNAAAFESADDDYDYDEALEEYEDDTFDESFEDDSFLDDLDDEIEESYYDDDEYEVDESYEDDSVGSMFDQLDSIDM